MKHLLVVIAFLLTACEPNELYPVGGIPLTGRKSRSYTAPTLAKNLAPIDTSPSQEIYGAVSR